MTTHNIWISVAALVCSVPASAEVIHAKCTPSEFKGNTSIRTQVERVVDGDTIKVVIDSKEYSVRFEGIDTPETHYEGKSQGVWGERAAKHLGEILPVNGSIVLEFGPEPCDKYGRLLAYVIYKQQNINSQMLKDAFAVNYCIYPQKGCEELADIVRANVEGAEGIFSDKSLVLPYEWRRIVSKRPYEKYVGNLFTHEVFKPGSLDRVPISDRIFFLKKSDIRAPYHLAD